MDVRPVDVALLRRDTAVAMDSAGPGLYQAAIDAGVQLARPDLPDREAAVKLADDETQRLRLAELFFVSGAMVNLAIVASETLPEFSIAAEDVPAPYGFVVFETPLQTVESATQPPVDIVAATWQVCGRTNGFDWPDGGIWVTWYSDARAALEYGAAHGMVDRRILQGLRAATPKLLPERETAIQFGRDFSSAEIEQKLRAVWLLMMQPLTATEPARYDRATLRRLVREKCEPAAVRVITLRRPKGPVSGSPGDREYHHQWIVRGHWRQQWYPARQVHRPVWIAPHIKGPEGAPLLGGEKVYALRR